MAVVCITYQGGMIASLFVNIILTISSSKLGGGRAKQIFDVGRGVSGAVFIGSMMNMNNILAGIPQTTLYSLHHKQH